MLLMFKGFYGESEDLSRWIEMMVNLKLIRGGDFAR